MNNKKTTTEIESLQKNYYNRIAKIYDEHYASPYALKYRFWVYDLILRDFDFNGKVVLDAMCGGGEASYYLLKKGANVIGLDISEECCKLYKKHFPNFSIVCSSILSTGFPDSYFDFIITDSLHHLHPNVNKGIEEIFRILKHGGYFCCWEPNESSFLNFLRKVWYKLDNKFFEENEQAININEIHKKFKNIKTIYGGNIAYLLVNCSMALRIPIKLVKLYNKPIFFLEKIISKIQPKILSLWVLSLMKKI